MQHAATHMILAVSLSLIALLLASAPRPVAAKLRIGTAMADVTGPTADINFMGYAMIGQVGGGLHIRLRARAFILESNVSATPGKSGRFAFVSVDMGMGSHAVTERVLQLLDADPTTKGIYTYDNLCISGTHTHSAPAGFLTHTIFQVTSLGWVHQTYEAFSTGIANAVIKANANLRDGRAFITTGEVDGANINRSPTAYTYNPAEERARYNGDTDTEMTMLKFVADDEEQTPLGMVNWYAVHGTAMNNTNKLVSGDNKGLASYLFEKKMNGEGVLAGEGDFVAAFAATNLGDVSPNTNGSFCVDTGLPCEMTHSTCNGKNELCQGRGPGKDMFESTEIIAKKQFETAERLWEDADGSAEELHGPVDIRSTWIDMTNLTFTSTKGETLSTCEPAMGYAFAAGTTDGPGMFNFVQGTNTSNPFWNAISHLISKPSDADIACHHPKPILLNLGPITEPYPWAARVVPLQLGRMGDFFFLSVPTELTTMAGRRLRENVAAEIKKSSMGVKDPKVVIAGLSLEYSDYTTTFEEYQAQRYEAASTAYGPNELEAFMSQFRRLVQDMAAKRPSESEPVPPTYVDKQIELRPGVLFDSVPIGKHFGDVTQQPPAEVSRGTRVSAVFRTANPRNNLRLEGTFLTVERQSADGKSWQTVANDADWSTQFVWERHFSVSAESYATINWDVPEDAQPGVYRIRHFNAHKSITGKITEFEGSSQPFSVK